MKKISEIALFSENVAALTSFYEKLLSAPPIERGPEMALFEIEGIQLLIHQKVPPEMGQPANEDHFALSIEDLDATSQALKKGRLLLELEPRDYEWGRSAYLRDPDGRLVELHEA